MAKKKKKPAITAAVPMSITEGQKRLHVGERIRRTFETGAKNAEFSIRQITAAKKQPSTDLRQVPKWLWKQDKLIADEFGGKINIHAPEDIAIESPTSLGQSRAADMIKHSLEVAEEMDSPLVNIHATGSRGWALTNPLSGTVESLPSHVSMPEPLWKKVMNDLENDGYTTVAHRLDREREIKRNSHMLQWRQQFWMEGKNRRRRFRGMAARKQSYDIVNETLSYSDQKKHLQMIREENPDGVRNLQREAKRIGMEDFDFTDPKDVKKFHKEWWDMVKKQNPTIGETKRMDEWIRDAYIDSERAWKLCDREQVDLGDARDTFFETWRKRLDPETVERIDHYMKEGKYDKIPSDMMDKMFEPFLDNIEDTFTILFKDDHAKKLLNSGKTKLAVENIFGPNFKTGATNGYPMGWSPKQMEMILNRIKKTAKKYNVDPDAIGMTFDTQHAIVGPGEALGTSSDLDWWFDEFKKRGMKIDHAHLVGGHKGSHDNFGHVGLGDVVDEVMRDHPDVIDKLAEAGCITFEPGEQSVKDLETSMETVLHGGTPNMAMAAEGGYKGGAAMMGYDQRPGSFYEGQYATHRASVTRGQFYAFSNPMERSAWQFAMGNTWYGTPAMKTPGAVTTDVRRMQKTWTKYQPY